MLSKRRSVIISRSSDGDLKGEGMVSSLLDVVSRITRKNNSPHNSLSLSLSLSYFCHVSYYHHHHHLFYHLFPLISYVFLSWNRRRISHLSHDHHRRQEGKVEE